LLHYIAQQKPTLDGREAGNFFKTNVEILKAAIHYPIPPPVNLSLTFKMGGSSCYLNPVGQFVFGQRLEEGLCKL